MTSVPVQPSLQPAPPDPAAEPPRSRKEASLPPASLPPDAAKAEKPAPKPPSGQPAAEQAGAQAMRLAVQKAADQINRKLAESFKDVRISVDDTLNRPVVRLVDANSGELVRQIPTEETIRIARRIEQVSGLLFDSKA
jgi:flagellar protein FlaG